MRKAVIVLLSIILIGCATEVRYLWQCPNGKCGTLQTDYRACIAETNDSYTPIVAGKAPKRTLFKDCMEKHGYTKLGEVDKGVHPEPGQAVTGIKN